MGKNTSKIEKVRLLLAKAESTTPEEAEALTEAALKLMARHGIDEAMLAASSPKAKKEDFVEKDKFYTSNFDLAFISLASHVVSATRTTKLLVTKSARDYETGKVGSRIHVFGFESDVERVFELILSLERQALSAQKAWWRDAPERQWLSPNDAWIARREFLFAFGRAVGFKLDEIYRQAVEETVSTEVSPEGKAVPAESKGTELVLLDRKAEVEAAVSDFYGGNLRKGRSSSRRATRYGREAGTEAGRRADVGQKRVSS